MPRLPWSLTDWLLTSGRSGFSFQLFHLLVMYPKVMNRLTSLESEVSSTISASLCQHQHFCVGQTSDQFQYASSECKYLGPPSMDKKAVIPWGFSLPGCHQHQSIPEPLCCMYIAEQCVPWEFPVNGDHCREWLASVVIAPIYCTGPWIFVFKGKIVMRNVVENDQ